MAWYLWAGLGLCMTLIVAACWLLGHGLAVIIERRAARKLMDTL